MITNKSYCTHRELCSMLSGSLDGREGRGRMDTCICMTESLHCPPETITTLLIGYACPVAQSCLTLCDPMDCSPPGSSVHGFPRREYWSGLPLSSPGNIPDSETQPASTYISCFASAFVITEPPGKSNQLYPNTKKV